LDFAHAKMGEKTVSFPPQFALRGGKLLGKNQARPIGGISPINNPNRENFGPGPKPPGKGGKKTPRISRRGNFQFGRLGIPLVHNLKRRVFSFFRGPGVKRLWQKPGRLWY